MQRSHTLAGLGAGLALALVTGCSEAPAPPAGTPGPRPEPQRLASFTVEYAPPTRAPGGGVTPGRALWTVVPEGRDGVGGTNPPRTIELHSIGAFVLPESGDPEAPYSNACNDHPLAAAVEVKNYFPERLVDAHLVFRNISDSARALCTSGEAPVGGWSRPADWPPPQFGVIYYVQPGATNRNSIAGSLVQDGSAPGGAAQEVWAFDYSQGAEPFTLAGDVYAELYPPRPYPLGYGAFGTPSYIWGSAAEENEYLKWGVADRGDAPGVTGDPLEDPRIVTASRFQVCTLVEGPPISCGTQVFEVDVPRAQSFADASEFFFRLPAAPDPQGLIAGQWYYFRLLNRWDPDGSGPAGMVTGSLPYAEAILIAGKAQLVAPADGGDVPAGGTLSWSVLAPEFFLSEPWGTPATGVVGWNRPTYRICADAACASVRRECPYGGSCDNPASEFTFTRDSQLPSATYTYFLTLTPELVAQAALEAGNTYYWQARNLYSGRTGEWSAPRAFHYTGP